MKMAAKRKKRNTYHRTRFALFTRSYAGCSISNYILKKYKIDENLTKSQLHEKFPSKKSIPEISRLSKTLNLNYKSLQLFVLVSRIPKLNVRIRYQEKVRVYLAIEKEMILLKIARQDKEDIVHEDYEGVMLASAIERIAGNNLRNIKHDDLFEKRLEELQKLYRNWYYEVANNFKLPTSRIVAFILRLISSLRRET